MDVRETGIKDDAIHVIAGGSKKFTAIIERRKMPHLLVQYDHLQKTGFLLTITASEELSDARKISLTRTAIEFAKRYIIFSDEEFDELKTNPKVQSQFQQFLHELSEEDKPNWSFRKFLNKKPFAI